MRIALALRKIGRDAVPPLYEALGDSDLSVRGWAAFTLGFVGIRRPASPQDLAEKLKDKDRAVRDRVIKACNVWLLLSRAGPPATRFEEALRANDPEARRQAIGGLPQSGPDPLLTFYPLAEALHDDPAPEVRSAAAVALGRIGPLALPELVAALEDSSGCVRGSAAAALGGIGPSADAAVPALIKLSQGKDRVVRVLAAGAIVKVDPVAAATAGIQWQKYND